MADIDLNNISISELLKQIQQPLQYRPQQGAPVPAPVPPVKTPPVQAAPQRANVESAARRNFQVPPAGTDQTQISGADFTPPDPGLRGQGSESKAQVAQASETPETPAFREADTTLPPGTEGRSISDIMKPIPRPPNKGLFGISGWDWLSLLPSSRALPLGAFFGAVAQSKRENEPAWEMGGKQYSARDLAALHAVPEWAANYMIGTKDTEHWINPTTKKTYTVRKGQTPPDPDAVPMVPGASGFFKGATGTKWNSDIAKIYADIDNISKSNDPDKDWKIANLKKELARKAEGTEKSQSTEQLVHQSLYDPDPKKREEAKRTLNEISRIKLEDEKKKANIGAPPPMAMGEVQEGQAGYNESALTGLSKEQAAIVKGLVDYKLPYPGAFALRTPYWQNMIGRAKQYDPTFDATQWQTRQRARIDFTSGKSAANIRSLNTAVAHLGTLSKKAEALNNAPVQIWNTIANYGLTATGDKRVVEFNAAANAVESELATVFKGMGASDQEIKAWRKQLSSSQSPEQLKGSINAIIELLSGRLNALRSQYETAMGKPYNFPILNDKSRKVLQDMGVDVDTLDPVSTQKAEINVNAPGMPAQLKTLPVPEGGQKVRPPLSSFEK